MVVALIRSWHMSCFYAGMNIFGAQLAADNSHQRVNDSRLDISKANLSISGSAGFDKLTFDSLLTNLTAAKIERSTSQANDYRAQETNSTSEDTYKGTAIDGRSNRDRYDEVTRGRAESGKNAESDTDGQDYRTDDISRRDAYKDEESGIEKTDNGGTVTESRAAAPQDDSTAEDSRNNEVRTAIVISELANRTDATADETPVVESAVPEVDGADSQDIRKSGDLLAQLTHGTPEDTAKNMSATTEQSSASGKGEQGVTGVKIGDILSALLSAKVDGDVKPQADPSQNNENAKAGNSETVKFENTPLKVEKSDKAPEMKTPGLNSEVITAQVKSADQNGSSADAEIEELLNRIHNNGEDKKAEIKQEHIKEVKSTEYMDAKEMQEGINVKFTAHKINPGIVENLIRESGVKINTNNAAKTVHAESDQGNAEMMTGVNVKSEGIRANSVLAPATAAKPSAFAEVVNKVVYVARGEKTLGVTVDHKDLGKINIKLSIDKGMVNVHINTTDKSVREFVENNMQQIVESLSKSGVSVGGFSVGLKNHQNHDGFGNPGFNRNERPFSIERMHEKEYVKAAANVYAAKGRVSILA